MKKRSPLFLLLLSAASLASCGGTIASGGVAAPTPTVGFASYSVSDELNELDLYRLQVAMEECIASYTKVSGKSSGFTYDELESQKVEGTVEIDVHDNDVAVLSVNGKETSLSAGIQVEKDISHTRYGFLDGGKAYCLVKTKDGLGVENKILTLSEEPSLKEVRATLLNLVAPAFPWGEAKGYAVKDGFDVVYSKQARQVEEKEHKEDRIKASKQQAVIHFDANKKVTGFSSYSESSANYDEKTGGFYNGEKVVSFQSLTATVAYDAPASYAEKAALVAEVPTTQLSFDVDKVIRMVKFPAETQGEPTESPEYLIPKNVYVSQLSATSYKVSAVFGMPSLDVGEMVGLFSGSHFTNLNVPKGDEDREEDFYFFLGIKGLNDLGVYKYLVEGRATLTTPDEKSYSADVLKATVALADAPDFVVSYQIGINGKQVGVGGLVYEKGLA